MLLMFLLLGGCSDPPKPGDEVVVVNNLPDTSAPKTPEDSVFRMEFEHARGSFEPGSGFVAHLPGTEWLIGVTAHHLFSPAGGLERELYAAEVPRFVLKINPLGPLGKKLPEVGPMLLVAGAEITKDRQDWTSDLAAFKVPDSYLQQALYLSPTNAKVGDVVWLITVPRKGGDPVANRAVVEVSTRTLLLFRFDSRKVDTPGASGAPLVNDKGEVVAVNMAEGDDGHALYGSAHPVESVIIKLKAAHSSQ
jgi:hypothetical protein